MVHHKLARSTVALLTVGLMVAIAFNPFINTMAWRFAANTNLTSIEHYYYGEEPQNMLGLSVANKGDVNGDHRDDIVFGAYNFSNAGDKGTGKFYIVLGKEPGKYGAAGHNATDADASFIGEAGNDDFGYSVDIAGDVNGDGYDDIIVGAPNLKGDRTGKAYLIFGRSSGWAKNDSAKKANVTFTGENLGDLAGYCVAGIGDINGDGFADLAIGAPHYSTPEVYSGAAYIFLGHAGAWNAVINLSAANTIITDPDTNAQLGSLIDGAGDVNGDHLDDFLFGTPNANEKTLAQAGKAFVVNGKQNGWDEDYDINNAAYTVFIGDGKDNYLGYCIGGGGDYNNDGYDDVLIGYKQPAFLSQNYYHVALYTGSPIGPKGGDQTNANVTFFDTSVSNAFDGLETCAWAGDANGDGYDDIILGDHTFRWGTNFNAGKAYLISGASILTVDGSYDAGAIAVSSFYDTTVDDHAGKGLSGGGDNDGDGYDDIVIGAYKYDMNTRANIGKAHLVFPDHNPGPGTIKDFNVYSDKDLKTVLKYADVGQKVYIRVNATGNMNLKSDTAMMKVTTYKGDPVGIIIPLRETMVDSAEFVGSVTLQNVTREQDQWIKAVGNETINFRPLNTTQGVNSLSFFVRGDFGIWPTHPVTTTLEDQSYSQHFWAKGCPPDTVTWGMQSNATWLNWEKNPLAATGLPNNTHVGVYSVKITISNIYDQQVSLSYNLTVKNVAPNILWTPKDAAAQHVLYTSDANCTDDGQGKITYSLVTNASWLSINITTGTLTGTPGAYDLGPYYANVSVDDGNGGKAFKNATINVKNTPDAPTINIAFPEKVPEDKAFEIPLIRTDPDKGDIATWSMKTNATSWLKIDNTKLYGIADDPEIGKYWVNITVMDGAGLADSKNYTLTIFNVEEAPHINSTPIDHATALLTYSYSVTAKDPDSGDVLSFSLTKAPTGMGIDGKTGTINWVPTRDQGGVQSVTVKVSDGVLSDNQTFTITVVTPATIPPQVTLVQPLDKSVINITNPQLSWEAEDPDSPLIYFDIYLSKDKGAVSARSTSARIGAGVTEVIISVSSDLEKGSTYYWIVDPNDGINQGNCTSGIWNFSIQKDAVQSSKPTSVLKAPIDNSTIKSLPVQLSWSGNDPDLDPLTYDIYVSQQIDLVQSLSVNARRTEDINATNLVLDGISVGTTYYWTVIPDDGTSKGDCLSGIWSFTVPTGGTVTNNPPTITSKPIKTAYVTQTYEYYVKANDTDGDRLSYSLVLRPKDMVIGFDDGHLIWLPKTDDLGPNDVTVRVSDGHVYVDQSFRVEVLPLSQMNHPPTIISTARTSAKVGVNYAYKVAASDIDNNILEYRLDKAPKGLKMDNRTGEISWKPKFNQAGSQQVNISISDGKATVWHNFTIKVERNPMLLSDSDPGYYLFLIILVIVISIIIIVAVLARRRSQSKARKEAQAKASVETASAVPFAEAVPVQEPVAPVVLKDEGVEDFKITEVFLIYHDGRLITYSTTEETEGLDKQIISGMLVAIQSFVKESFQSQQGLDSFEFGDKKVILKGGKYVVLAAVLNGVEPHVLREEMLSIITRIETLYAGKVERWDGNIETFADAPRHMSPLFHLRNRLKIKEKEKGVRMKSGVEFYSGYVRLKVGVSNELEGPISNINIDLAYDINTLRLSHIEPKYPISDNTIYLPDILPNEKRTVAVYFDPLICQESHIDGKVRFIDPAGNEGEAHMKRRPVDVVCPIFYTIETINVAMLKRLLGELSYSDSRIYEVKDPGALAGAHDMAVVSVRGHDVKLVREFTETEPYEVETWFYGEAKESEEKLVIKVSSRSNGSLLEIFVASDNLASMTGLLAELGNEFRKKMDEKGIDRESLLLSTDEKMKDVLKETKLLLDKFADAEVEPEENEPRAP
jgi:hypothetical protein